MQAEQIKKNLRRPRGFFFIIKPFHFPLPSLQKERIKGKNDRDQRKNVMITDFSHEYLISQLKIFEFPYFIPTFTDNLTIELLYCRYSCYIFGSTANHLHKSINMNFKKIKLWALFLCLSALTGIQAQSLFVVGKSGATSDFTLTSLRSITFAGTDLVLNKKDGSTSIPYSIADLRFLSFSQYTEVTNPGSDKSEINIYPNPVHDMLNIQYLSNKPNENRNIEILSIDGKIMYNKPFELNNTVQSINTNTWSRGIYLLRFNNGTEVISKKIIKN